MSVDQIKEEVMKRLDHFDGVVKKFDQVKDIEKKTGVRPVFLALGAVVGTFLLILLAFGASPLCNIVGFAYPLYASFKALKSKDLADDKQWLTYWIVYGFFTLTESLTDLLLNWIPAYYFVKMGFLIWCYLPQTQGATVVYHKVILPVLHKAEGHIDNTVDGVQSSLDKGKAAVSDIINDAVEGAKKQE